MHLTRLLRPLRRFSGDVRRGGGKFSEREHAQEEQYFRKKEKEEIEKYRSEMEEASKKQKGQDKDTTGNKTK